MLTLKLEFLEQNSSAREKGGEAEQAAWQCARPLLVSSVVLPFQQVLCLLPCRCACIDARHAQKASRKWTLEMDVALVQYINRLCRHLAITPARLHPHEVYLDPADAADPRISCLLST